MPMRGPVPLSFLYPLAVCVQVWPAESVTVKLSVPLDDSRTKATRRSPGLLVMDTENEVKAAPLTSMLFWTRTKAGGEPPVELVPVPVRLAVWGLPLALSVMASTPVRDPVTVGLNVTLTEQFPPAATLVPQLFVWAKSPLAAMLEMLRA